MEEIKTYYLAAKVDCEKFLLNYTIDEKSLPDYWPDPKLFGKAGQPHCRGTPQLFEITKGLIAWPFGPLKNCPTYRKCWFGVLTCGRVDLNNMRALIHSQVRQRLHEIGKISDPVIHALYSSNVPLMTRWSIRALRLAMRVNNHLVIHYSSSLLLPLLLPLVHYYYYYYHYNYYYNYYYHYYYNFCTHWVRFRVTYP